MQGTYSKKMYVDLDMQNNEILGLTPEIVSTLPTTNLKVGRIVVKDAVQYICVSTTGTGDQNWQPLAKGGDLTDYQLKSEKDQANGYAGLNASSKIQIAEIPTGAIQDGATSVVPTAGAVYTAIQSAVTGLYKIMGSATVAQINNAGQSGGIQAPTVGDVYNVTDSGTITLGNITVIAGDNVVYIKTSDSPATYAWDKLAGTIDVSSFVTLTGAQTVDGKTFTNVVSINSYVPGQAMAKSVDTSSGSLSDSDAYVPTSKLVASELAGKMDAISGDVGSGIKPVFVDDGAITASTSTVGGTAKPVFLNAGTITAIGTGTAIGGATQPIYLASDGTITAGTAIGTAGYKTADTGTISSSSTDNAVPTSLTVYEALTGGVVTKVGTADKGSPSKPIYLEDGVPTAVTSIDKSLLPTGIGFIYTATITGDGTTKSWTLPLSGDSSVYADPASVSIRDSSGNEVGMHVQYTTVNNVKHVVISTNTAIPNATSYTVKIVA